jgi:hypothetical protein
MTPTNYAAEELAMWQEALREQRDAEALLAVARANRSPDRFELATRVEALSTRADLLLANASRVKAVFRDHTLPVEWVSSTQSELHDGPGTFAKVSTPTPEEPAP